MSSACLSAFRSVQIALPWRLQYLRAMIIRRVVFAWFVMATLGSLITYFAYSDHHNKWFVVLQTVALSVILLPVLFLMTFVYYRFFIATRRTSYGFASYYDK